MGRFGRQNGLFHGLKRAFLECQTAVGIILRCIRLCAILAVGPPGWGIHVAASHFLYWLGVHPATFLNTLLKCCEY